METEQGEQALDNAARDEPTESPAELLSRREAELGLREARLAARDELERRQLPLGLIHALPLGRQEDTQKALDEVERAFRSAVEDAVTQRLKGRPPVLGGGERNGNAALRRAFGLRELGE